METIRDKQIFDASWDALNYEGEEVVTQRMATLFTQGANFAYDKLPWKSAETSLPEVYSLEGDPYETSSLCLVRYEDRSLDAAPMIGFAVTFLEKFEGKTSWRGIKGKVTHWFQITDDNI